MPNECSLCGGVRFKDRDGWRGHLGSAEHRAAVQDRLEAAYGPLEASCEAVAREGMSGHWAGAEDYEGRPRASTRLDLPDDAPDVLVWPDEDELVLC